MRLFKNYILLLLLVVFSNFGLHAKPQPDQPTQQATGVPITPPTTPIDKNLILLGFVATLFGSYTIYKTHKPIKKASN